MRFEWDKFRMRFKCPISFVRQMLSCKLNQNRFFDSSHQMSHYLSVAITAGGILQNR